MDTIYLVPTAVLIAAPCIGSFLGVVVERLPIGHSIVHGRSHCPHCRTALSAIDLVPLLSWLYTGGLCRHCAGRLGLFYPAVELAAVMVALSTLIIVPEEAVTTVAFSLILGWMLLTLALIDARHYLLPDALTLPLIGMGLLSAWALTPSRLSDHCIGALAGYLGLSAIAEIYRRLRGRAGLGGGDAKLMAAAGAWLSWQSLPSVLLLASIIGLTAHLAAWRVRSDHKLSLQDKLPFGPALAAAIWAVWLFGPFQLEIAGPFA
jgi:leader peptidase (prepilin peptidase)/N-methyltransferase